jgi:hypothetical protein
MNARRWVIAVAVSLLFQPLAHAGSRQSRGELRVQVVDETGAYVPGAQIFLCGPKTTAQTASAGRNGPVSFSVPTGFYRVYSAVRRTQGDFTDRFASYVAYVHVESGNQASVILTLRKIQTPVVYLNESTRRKIGLDSALTQYVN